MNKVIAFSLWGQSPKYWIGAQRNIALAAQHYPGWRCRFYVEAQAPDHLVALLRGDNVEIERMERRDEFGGLFWRFYALADPAVDIVLSRDCDSRIGPREAAAVAAWLANGKDVHIMRDHPYHQTAILGGMWGCRGGALRHIQALMAASSWPDAHGSDQRFLADVVYPLIRDRALEHSEFGLAYGGATLPFPTPRRGDEFVGEVFDERERRQAEIVGVLVAALRAREQPEKPNLFKALKASWRALRRALIRRDKAPTLS